MIQSWSYLYTLVGPKVGIIYILAALASGQQGHPRLACLSILRGLAAAHVARQALILRDWVQRTQI